MGTPASPPAHAGGAPDGVTPDRVAVVIPAKDEADRIAATIAAVRTVPGVDLVVVVDDGSTDATQSIAAASGAVVARHTRNQGKAAAMATGAAVVARRDERDTEPGMAPRALLFVDADLEQSAANVAPLTGPILDGSADLTIAILPTQHTAGGGRGFVVSAAREGIIELTGWTPTQPLSGMRAMTRAAYDAAQPFAPGWGVETAMTIDVLRAGLRVVEVPCDLHHRVTGADWRGQLHRAQQYRDVRRALAVRRLARRLGR